MLDLYFVVMIGYDDRFMMTLNYDYTRMKIDKLIHLDISFYA